MPFIDTSDIPSIPTFYNVVNAVGKNCPNRREDVKLVQHLLRGFYAGSGYAPPKGNMIVDGFCGPITRSWIQKFQTDLKAQTYSISTDGRMDRVRNHQITGGTSGTVYGLLWLNYMASYYDPTGYAAVPSIVMLQDPNSVPAPANDYVPDQPSTQSTSPGGGPRTMPSSAVIPATGGI